MLHKAIRNGYFKGSAAIVLWEDGTGLVGWKLDAAEKVGKTVYTAYAPAFGGSSAFGCGRRGTVSASDGVRPPVGCRRCISVMCAQ